MDAGQDLLDIASVAGRIGITPEAVRKRIARGSLEATKQDGRWYVAMDGQDGHGPASTTANQKPDAPHWQEREQDASGQRQDDKDRLIDVLQGQVRSQGDELDARRREVQELHVLLQQAALPSAGDRRPWWRRVLAGA